MCCAGQAPNFSLLDQGVWSQRGLIHRSNIVYAALSDARLADIEAALVHEVVPEAIAQLTIDAEEVATLGTVGLGREIISAAPGC